jgi:hypothetical protein
MSHVVKAVRGNLIDREWRLIFKDPHSRGHLSNLVVIQE